MRSAMSLHAAAQETAVWHYALPLCTKTSQPSATTVKNLNAHLEYAPLQLFGQEDSEIYCSKMTKPMVLCEGRGL